MAGNRRRGPTGAATTVRNVVAIVVLTAVVAVLVVIAMSQNRGVTNAGATPGASAVPSVTPTPTPSAPVEPTTSTTVAVPTRALAALDGQNAVRAASTTCPEPTSVEVTSDGGATWTTSEPATVAAVQSIEQGSDAYIGLVGLGVEGCSPSYERSFTDGAGWEIAPDELGAGWYIDPADRASVHSPSGSVAAPCSIAVQVVAIDDASAAVLCDDANVHATVDGGASWGDPVAMPGAAAIAVGGSGYRIAVINANACVGAQVVGLATDGAALVPDPAGGCLPATVPAGGIAVAADLDDGMTWIWAGDVLARSEDGGVSWL